MERLGGRGYMPRQGRDLVWAAYDHPWKPPPKQSPGAESLLSEMEGQLSLLPSTMYGSLLPLLVKKDTKKPQAEAQG